MSSTSTESPAIDLGRSKIIHANLSSAELVEHAILNGEAQLTARGALTSRTGKYTGRTPKDKHVVREPLTEANIWWENNNAMTPEVFQGLKRKAEDALAGKTLYTIDSFGGADPASRIRVRFVVEQAWHALFVKQLLIRPNESELQGFEPDWTIIDLGRTQCDPAKDGTRSEAVIALNFAERTVLIFGTEYAGELKKSVFTIMNYLLPLKGILTMHCSANIGAKGDTCLFFGLSGTGKTTLSADPARRLIGDDEHGWSDNGVFNIEGGCYAKCINLSAEGEPQIYNAIRFGAVLENVVLGDGRVPDFTDKRFTENTRCAYPVDFIEGAVIPSVGGHPSNIMFLTCDAFGVLPPISRLSPEQAMRYFLNGYTAKVAGTEAGVTEPSATFSTCFGAPFLPLPPKVYADLLNDRIARHSAKVWLVNTGWTGSPYGVGSRMKLGYTRSMIEAALRGDLDSVSFETDPVFGLSVPVSCPDVPSEILSPRNTWSDKAAYDEAALKLIAMFDENYERLLSGMKSTAQEV